MRNVDSNKRQTSTREREKEQKKLIQTFYNLWNVAIHYGPCEWKHSALNALRSFVPILKFDIECSNTENQLTINSSIEQTMMIVIATNARKLNVCVQYGFYIRIHCRLPLFFCLEKCIHSRICQKFHF